MAQCIRRRGVNSPSMNPEPSKLMKGGDETMSKDWTDQILDSRIAEMYSEYARRFNGVRRHTEDRLQAWLVVEDLLERFPPKWKIESKHKPIEEDQLSYLRGLGIRKLRDLSWYQAAVLTNCVLAEGRDTRGGKTTPARYTQTVVFITSNERRWII